MGRREEVVRYIVLFAGLTALASSGIAQSIPFDIRPARLEVEVSPGAEKTVSFRIETGTGGGPARQTVTLDPTDWTTQEDGAIKYSEPGTTTDSASKWVQFSPRAFAETPSANQLVRITVAVPADAAPGAYRSGIFVQERTPSELMSVDQPTVRLRVRYVFFLYVIVPPVKAAPELTQVECGIKGANARLGYTMKNSGNLHVRPLVRWAIRNERGEMTGAPGEHESTVLLPHATLREAFEFPAKLPPGRYQLAVLVDFRDGEPLQSMTQTLDVADAPGASDAPPK